MIPYLFGFAMFGYELATVFSILATEFRENSLSHILIFSFLWFYYAEAVNGHPRRLFTAKTPSACARSHGNTCRGVPSEKPFKLSEINYFLTYLIY